MNKIIPSVIEDNGEYYIHIEEYKKVKELGEHYKHLYSEVKKQKDDIVEYIKSLRIYGLRNGKMLVTKILNKILRMLGEIDVED